MARGRTFDQEQRARELFDKGLGCNAIAKELSVSPSTISGWAKGEGLSFVARAQTATATVVREFDMTAARVRLAEKLTRNADESFDSLDAPFVVYSFGGKDNDYNDHTFDEAPLSARREAQTIGAIAFDKLSKALEKDVSGVVAAYSLLDALIVGFDSRANEYGSSDENVE